MGLVRVTSAQAHATHAPSRLGEGRALCGTRPPYCLLSFVNYGRDTHAHTALPLPVQPAVMESPRKTSSASPFCEMALKDSPAWVKAEEQMRVGEEKCRKGVERCRKGVGQ